MATLGLDYKFCRKYGPGFVDIHFNPYLRRYVVIWQKDPMIRGRGSSIEAAHMDLYKCALGIPDVDR